MKTIIRILVATGIIAFGLMTLYLSGSVIFDLFDMRAKQGNYVSFVIWANFICGFLYLLGGYGLLKQKPWSIVLFRYALMLLVITYMAFIIYVEKGGVHKTDTFKALAVRTGITIIAFLTSFLTINKKNEYEK